MILYLHQNYRMRLDRENEREYWKKIIKENEQRAKEKENKKQ